METRSSITNDIIELCRKVRAGTAELSALEKTLLQHRNEVATARQTLTENLSALSAEATARVRLEAAALTRAYQAYAVTLDRLLPALDSGQAEPLEEALVFLVAVTEDLMRAMESFQARFSSVGPTEYPEVNRLLMLRTALVSGQLNATGFKMVVDASREYYQKALHDARQQNPPLSLRAAELMADGFQQHLAALDEIERYLEDRQEAHFDAGFAAMEKAHSLIKQGFEARGPLVQSHPINYLIASCQNGVDGRIPFSEVAKLLGQARALMEQERAAFQTEATRQPPSDELRDRIAEVQRGYASALSALRALEKCANAADGDGLQEGIAPLRDAAEQLFNAAQAFTASMVAAGPTPWIPLNRVLDAIHDIKAGAETRLDDLLGSAREHMQGCLQLAASPPSEEMAAASAILRDGFARVLQGLAEAEAYLADQQKSHLEACEATITAAYDTLQTALGPLLYQAVPPGPTPSPLANGFLSVLEVYKDGGCLLAVVQNQLRRLDEFLDSARGHALMLEQTFRESAPLQVEVMRMQKALDVHEQANNIFHKALLAGDRALLDEGTSLLIQAVGELETATKALSDMVERQDRQTCPRCGASNDLYNRFCTSCKSALPQYRAAEGEKQGPSTFALTELPGSEGGVRPALTENVKKVLDAARQVRNGSINAEQFLSVLNWMESQLERGVRRAGKLPSVSEESLASMEQQNPQLKPTIMLAAEAYQMMAEGAAHMRAGLAEMRLYQQDGDAQHLQDGSRMVFDASLELRQAGHVGEMIVTQVEEMRGAPESEPAVPSESVTIHEQQA